MERKLPVTLTGQVLVGYLDDLFSRCVFRSVPESFKPPVPLVHGSKAKNPHYMLVIKWSKEGIQVQTISHNFAVKEVVKNSQNNTLMSLVIGFLSGLKKHSENSNISSKVPLSLFKGLIPDEMNKGGSWAYNCVPSLLLDVELKMIENADVLKSQAARRDKLMNLVKNDFYIIDPCTILALLWSFYYLDIYDEFRDVCSILCNEFIEHYHDDIQGLVYLLFFCRRMNLISDDMIKNIINTKLNNVSVLEKLTLEDIVILVNSIKPESNATFSGISSKVMMVLNDFIGYMSKEMCIYLLYGLVEMNFDFAKHSKPTARILNRIIAVFDDLPAGDMMLLLFNALMRATFNTIPYFNVLLDKVMRKFHLINQEDVIQIGCSYAIAHENTKLLGAKANDHSKNNNILGVCDKPEGKHIYKCLKYVVIKNSTEYRPEDAELLTVVYDSLLHRSAKQIPGNPLIFNEKWVERDSKRIKLSGTRKSNTCEDVDVNANDSAYSNSIKLFYLNLIEDCYGTFDKLSYKSVDKIIFSMLTLNIDIEPLHQIMLIHKGELTRRRNDSTCLKLLTEDWSRRIKQFEMARDIMQFTRNKDDPDAELIIEGIIPKCELDVVTENDNNTVTDDKEEEVVSEEDTDSEGEDSTDESVDHEEDASLDNEDNDEKQEREYSKDIKMATELLFEIVNKKGVNEILEVTSKLSESTLTPGNPIYEAIQHIIKDKLEPTNQESAAIEKDQSDVNAQRKIGKNDHKNKSGNLDKGTESRLDHEDGKSSVDNEDEWEVTSGSFSSQNDIKSSKTKYLTSSRNREESTHETKGKKTSDDKSVPVGKEKDNVHKQVPTGKYIQEAVYQLKPVTRHRARITIQEVWITYNYSNLKHRFTNQM